MPTANRPACLEAAIYSFLKQTYQNKELLILDDGKFPLQGNLLDSIKAIPGVYYSHVPGKRNSIGAKLNTLCEQATGEIIARFDDDDFSAPGRLAHQVSLICAGVEYTGFHTCLFYDHPTGKVYKYYSSRNYAVGATFTFTRKLWKLTKFDEMVVTGTDNQFQRKACKVLQATDGSTLFVAGVHPGNSNHKNYDNYEYKEILYDAVPKEFNAYLEIYTKAKICQ